jgi:hypothetical protein
MYTSMSFAQCMRMAAADSYDRHGLQELIPGTGITNVDLMSKIDA